MSTIFGLFANYEDANTAVKTLQSQGVDPEDINVVVQEGVVRNELDGELGKANTAVTDKVGEQTLFGLDKIVGGHQPMQTASVGEAHAVGSLATTLAKTASAPGAVDGDLRAALVDFGIPENAAETYWTGLTSGQVLLGVRTDEAQAAETAKMLRAHKGTQVANYAN
jgi:hypothetical protein